MLRPLAVMALLVAVVGLPTEGSAQHYCRGDGIQFAIGVAGETVAYATWDREIDSPGVLNIFVESNGIEGLQRGGTDILGYADECPATLPPDMYIIGATTII